MNRASVSLMAACAAAMAGLAQSAQSAAAEVGKFNVNIASGFEGLMPVPGAGARWSRPIERGNQRQQRRAARHRRSGICRRKR